MSEDQSLFAQEAETEETIEETVDYVEALVGPDKRYKDLEALAKSRIHADQHIRDLEDEAKHNREHRSVLENILSELRKNRSNENTEVEPPTRETQVPTMDIEKTVEQALDRKESERKQAQNREECIKKLSDQFGSREQAISELKAFGNLYPNLKPHFESLGASDPDAFVRLFNSYAKPGTSGETVNPGVSGRPSADAIASVTKDLTWSEAKDIKKTNPTMYHSREFQDKLVQTVARYQEKGKDFFKT